MPFNIFKNSSNVNYKSRLERKMVIARETPEPVFDLSDCNLKNIPNGVFSLCHVFLKEALLLQNNSLTNLSAGGKLEDLSTLKILNLSTNNINKLPEDLSALKHLQVFLLSNNQITELPSSIGALKKLRKLDLSNNRLKILPKTLGRCQALEELNLVENLHLMKLPVELGCLHNLKSISTDSHLSFPPFEITNQGTEAVKKFLSAECGEPPPDDVESTPRSDVSSTTDSFILQETLKLYEQRKDSQQKERLALEKTLAEEKKKELELHLQVKGRNQKFVEDIRLMQTDLDDELIRIHQRKDSERARLIKECLKDENEACSKVLSLLDNAKKNQEKLVSLTEKEDEVERQLLFDIHVQSLAMENNTVIDSMNLLVQEELQKAEKFRKYEEEKNAATKSWITEDTELTKKLSELVANSRCNSEELRKTLLADEGLQKAAVATLLEKSDTRSWQLSNQVAAVERQLAELTKLELTRRKLEIDEHIVELGMNRVALTEHLMSLLDQQQSRRQYLVSALRRMEEAQAGEEFWFGQYERLMGSTSKRLVETCQCVDTLLSQELVFHGVVHYMPLLADRLTSRDNISRISDSDLAEMGITSADDRILLLKTFKNYLKTSCPVSSSAPLESPVEASAPPMSPSLESFPGIVPMSCEECVVCLEEKVDAIFIPCGHMCCCRHCANLSTCPLCRSDIQVVIHPSKQSS